VSYWKSLFRLARGLKFFETFRTGLQTPSSKKQNIKRFGWGCKPRPARKNLIELCRAVTKRAYIQLTAW